MDRRTTLSKLLGQKIAQTTVAPIEMVSGLTPYSGPFQYEQAAHLLRRTTFGANYQQIKEVANMGLDSALYQLFTTLPIPEAPVNPSFTDDTGTQIGETWVNKPVLPNVMGFKAYRDQSLRSWTLDLIRTESINIREKMVLFWHNHFPTADIFDTRFVYNYSKLLREHATGNFKELTKAMTIDPAMLVYLNGRDNTATSPNENYARELLELFTIGKGPLVGPNDYTNYTEQDVVEMAKVLTGWRINILDNPLPNVGTQSIVSVFNSNFHNTTTKELSFRFNNTQIPNAGAQEYSNLIDIIFSQDECARFICRKLYRWFVYYEISQQVEDEVIAPMAQIMLANDYEIRPALEALLRSEHFFDILNFGPMIKNPIDFTMGVFRIFDIDFSQASLAQNYGLLNRVYTSAIQQMQMPYYDPPSVAGWKAYYQEPSYYRTWINAVTLPFREGFVKRMLTNNGITFSTFDDQGNEYKFTTPIDVLKFAASIDNPIEPNNLIDEFVKILFPQPITQGQHDYLKGILLPGLPDYEWTDTYNAYLNAPNNNALKNEVTVKLRQLLTGMMTMPEFYLS
ncbi:MAG: DUF1800 family protein [Bacteroidetes bacterium]|nr:DUF1800 family protein [Bacteroidota bacterium]